MELKQCNQNFLGFCHLYTGGTCSQVSENVCSKKKEAADGYTRKWLRDCLNFWQRQWHEVDGTPRQLSYEQACVMVAGADCKTLYRGTPYWKGEPYKESEVLELFQSEFSEGYELCKRKYGKSVPYKIIPNYKQ